MKMLNDAEISIINKYKSLKIPAIYKTDNTDRILFIEYVDFDICTSLLKNKKIDKKEIEEAIKEYSYFLSQTSISTFDEESLYHFKILNIVMGIFFKYNL